MPQPNVQIIGGNFQDIEGNPLSLGYIDLKLNHNGLSSSGQVCSGITSRVALDTNGNVSGTLYIWANDALLPSGSYYSVKVFSSNGRLSWGRHQVYILSSPNPYNLNLWNP